MERDIAQGGAPAPRRTAAPAAADDIDRTAINTIRTLAIDAVEKADSGHAGSPMGQAPVAYTEQGASTWQSLETGSLLSRRV